MAASKEDYTAAFFKKESHPPIPEKIDDVSVSDLDRFVAKYAALHEDPEASSSEDEDSSQTKTFSSEDRVVAKLYRQVVDGIMAEHRLQEWHVNRAIFKMKSDIHVGHKTSFRRFEIDFCRAAARCGYLRRYAVCHTGLVKKAVWRFLAKHPVGTDGGIPGSGDLKVVSLGGGPGSDMIGFCCALQETGNDIARLDLKIVDISQGWVQVFSSILKVACKSDFGSLSQLLSKTRITTSFLKANLNSEEAYDDDTLLSVLEQADVVLMVKVLSFIKDQAAESIIQRVVNSMSEGSLLIFIDQPYDREIFERTPCLRHVYHHYHKYELSFKPGKYHCPAIDCSQASIGVFVKDNSESEFSDSDEF